MELNYLKEMKKHGLTKAELPEDAKIGIDAIDQIQKAIHLAEKKGNKIRPETYKKLASFDKWVYFEILDYVNDTEKNTPEMPGNPDEVIASIEAGKEEVVADTPGKKIEAELQKMFEGGKTSWTIDEIKSAGKNVYDAIFVGYKEGDANGIETTMFSLIETTEKQVYSLKKL